MNKLTREEALDAALSVVSKASVAVLATTDERGAPQLRYMAFATLRDGLRRIYCLTGKQTRKIEQIRRTPNVVWMFTDESSGRIITLHGKAEVLDSSLATQQVWDRLVRAGEPYLVSILDEESSPEFHVIETTVTRMELLAPRERIFQPMLVDLSPAREAKPA
jgi:general stress protein 26